MANEERIIDLLEKILDKLDYISSSNVDTAFNTGHIETNTSNLESALQRIEDELNSIKRRI